MSGKGSKQRPAQVPDSVVAENWKRIFGDGNHEIFVDSSFENADVLKAELERRWKEYLNTAFDENGLYDPEGRAERKKKGDKDDTGGS